MKIRLQLNDDGSGGESVFHEAVDDLKTMDVDIHTEDTSIGFYSYGSAREYDSRRPVSVVDGHEDIRLIVAGSDRGMRVSTMLALFEAVGVCDKDGALCRLVATTARDDGEALGARICWAAVEEAGRGDGQG